MIETTKIPRERLTGYFDKFSRHFLMGESTIVADVDVIGKEIGDQPEAEGARITGITYDAKDNALELEFEGGVHRISRPVEVWTVEETDGFVKAIEIVRADNTREVVRVRRLSLQPKDGA
jgi:hypothetical protein